MPSTYYASRFGIKDHHLREFFELVRNSQVSVITGPVGSGKSTLLPYKLMVPPSDLPQDLFTRNGQIVVTQPRTQSTRFVAEFVARELHSSGLGPGYDIGFRHRGSTSADSGNKLIYITDGVLINMIQRNELGALSVIMIDEAHERSLNTDLILGLLKAQLPLYPHLRLIISSATIDVDLFVNYFGGSGVVARYDFPGVRQFPVELRFRTDDPVPLSQMPIRAVQEVAEKVLVLLEAMEDGSEPVRGGVLVFLHSARAIEQACAAIRKEVEEHAILKGKVDVFPLYASLPVSMQAAALTAQEDSSKWRVVISTNIAETSVTVPGVVHVVDSGLVNVTEWDPLTQTSFVVTSFQSQAGCRQRWGRAGRSSSGVAHCIYTEKQFSQFQTYGHPEILRAPLEHVILQAKLAGIEDIREFDWIQRPSDIELSRAPHLLRAIGALDVEGDLTEHGLRLAQFSLKIDTANLLILADRFGCAVEMATFLSMCEPIVFRNLLSWDSGWTVAAKRATHQANQGLIRRCADDVELCLRLWDAWEQSTSAQRTGQQQEDWRREISVNDSLFRDRIAPTRQELLELLVHPDKADDTRPVDFDILPRVRIVLTYGLPHSVYELVRTRMPGGQSAEAPLYTNATAGTQYGPEETRFKIGSRVQISQESVCYGNPPSAFVCGSLRRSEEQASPESELQTTVYASCLSLTKPEWMRCIGGPLMSVARLIAAERLSDPADLVPAEDPHPFGKCAL